MCPFLWNGTRKRTTSPLNPHHCTSPSPTETRCVRKVEERHLTLLRSKFSNQKYFLLQIQEWKSFLLLFFLATCPRFPRNLIFQDLIFLRLSYWVTSLLDECIYFSTCKGLVNVDPPNIMPFFYPSLDYSKFPASNSRAYLRKYLISSSPTRFAYTLLDLKSEVCSI